MKRIITYILVLALCAAPVAYASANDVWQLGAEWSVLAPTGPVVNAAGAVLMEKETGRVLYEQNAHEAMKPASVTKVMSLLLVGEALAAGRLTLSEMVTCSEHAASMGGSQIYLEPGEQMSVEDMIKAVVLGSANDAVVALGEHIAGSEDAFVQMMNAKAAELGMNDTVFVNACGLDADGHVTSAYDIALMSRALLLEYPEIKRYTTIWMDSVRGGEFQLSNTNKLVKTYTGITGLKTGFTSASGHCLAATAERGGMELVVGILRAPSSADRFSAAKQLLDFGFANYAVVDVLPGGELAPIPVSLGKADYVQPVPASGGKALLDKALVASVTHTLTVAETLDAPVSRGQVVGEMVITAGGGEIARIPVVAADDVEKLGFMDVYGRLLGKLFGVDK